MYIKNLILTLKVESTKGEIDYGTVFKILEELLSLKSVNSYTHNQTLVSFYILSLNELKILYKQLRSDMFNEYPCKVMIFNDLVIRFESIYNNNDEKIVYFNEISSYIISNGLIISHETEGTVFWFTQYPVLVVLVVIYYIALCIKLR